MDNAITPERGAGWVRAWLLLIALMVYAMILVGGATRLTDSGLSITEWKPITGAIPPLSADHWAEEFQKYREYTAEYQLQNKGMSLEEFKFIYWWEWGHRLLGRLIGVVFILPFLVFWAMGFTTPKLRLRLWGLFALGGLQGFIGWWMVSSGVGDTTRLDVAPYRLMTHFTLALVIIGACIWVWLDLKGIERDVDDRGGRSWALILLLLATLQMMLGALVAGLDAGRTYTDWPMMDRQFVPEGYWFSELGLRNVFENEATAQFNHRILAYILMVLALFAGWRHPRMAGGWFKWLAAIVCAQASLGVYTLIMGAPLWLGLAHQGLGVVLVITAIVVLWRCSAPQSLRAAEAA